MKNFSSWFFTDFIDFVGWKFNCKTKDTSPVFWR